MFQLFSTYDLILPVVSADRTAVPAADIAFGTAAVPDLADTGSGTAAVVDSADTGCDTAAVVAPADTAAVVDPVPAVASPSEYPACSAYSLSSGNYIFHLRLTVFRILYKTFPFSFPPAVNNNNIRYGNQDCSAAILHFHK
mgnify:CR=1 FL=1